MEINDIRVRKSCNFHACLRYVMRFARWTGFFPVQGLNQLTANGTKFKIMCLYGVYNIATLMGQVVMLFFSVHYFLDSEVTLVSLSNVVFYVTSLIAAMSLVRLAKRWPILVKIAEETEQSLTMLELDNYTVKKSNIIACMAITISLVIHILSINFSVKLTMEYLSKTTLNEQIIAAYTKINMSYIFNYVPYSAFKAALAMICFFQTTFLWSFVDVFTICFSIYITSYFYNLNKIIRSKKNNNTISWGQLREHYSKLALLVKEMDAQFCSTFILLSFFTDLYFICLQLFSLLHISEINYKNCGANIFNSVLTSPDYFLYHYTSFFFLILRSICLFLFAANVHNAGQKPIISVYSVQSEEYDQEVQRFQLILRFTTVALSGKFFYVTRNTILQAISTIITYELVLLQFSRTRCEDDLSNNTTTITN